MLRAVRAEAGGCSRQCRHGGTPAHVGAAAAAAPRGGGGPRSPRDHLRPWQPRTEERCWHKAAPPRVGPCLASVGGSARRQGGVRKVFGYQTPPPGWGPKSSTLLRCHAGASLSPLSLSLDKIDKIVGFHATLNETTRDATQFRVAWAPHYLFSLEIIRDYLSYLISLFFSLSRRNESLNFSRTKGRTSQRSKRKPAPATVCRRPAV